MLRPQSRVACPSQKKTHEALTLAFGHSHNPAQDYSGRPLKTVHACPSPFLHTHSYPWAATHSLSTPLRHGNLPKEAASAPSGVPRHIGLLVSHRTHRDENANLTPSRSTADTNSCLADAWASPYLPILSLHRNIGHKTLIGSMAPPAMSLHICIGRGSCP